jgi:transposase
MEEINLTKEKKAELECRHDKARDGRVRDRIKVILLRSENWSTTMIAQALRLHETTILRHIKDYLTKEKLKPNNGGSKSHLSTPDTKKIIHHLSDKTYRYSYEIIEYIWVNYQVKFSISGLNKWLHQQGFSYKKPKPVPHKFDPQKQAEFIERYQQLKSQAIDEPILFIDAMHPTQATKISYCWIKKGDDKPIETTGSRTRLNIVGAINLKDLGAAIINRYETVNSKNMQHFFEKIRAQYPNNKAIHLILDGAGYHRAKDLVSKAKELSITLHYLPPYSPNLNPIERLWKVMNEQVRNNQYFSSAKQFRDKIDQFFDETLPQISATLYTRINDNFQILNHAS